MPVLPSDRHGSAQSSGADSWRSDDTVKPSTESRTPRKLGSTDDRRWEDGDISPSTSFASEPFTFYQRSPNPPAQDDGDMSERNFGSFSHNQTYNDFDSRRPSVASATTVSSNGSNQSYNRSINQRMHDSYDENSLTEDSRQTSQPELGKPKHSKKPTTKRTTSFSKAWDHGFRGQRQNSPDKFAPKTAQAQPSSEVTPWLYQDPSDVNAFSEAPVRDDLSGDNSRGLEKGSSKEASKSHRLHVHRHRHNKSSDDSPRNTPNSNDSSSVRSDHSSQSTLMPSRSDTESTPVNKHVEPTGKSNNSGKRSLIDKLIHRKPNRNNNDSSKSAGSSTMSLPFTNPKPSPSRSNLASGPSSPQEINNDDSKASLAPTVTTTTTKNTKTKLRGQKTQGSKMPLKDANTLEPGNSQNQALWNLDTDLSDMQGIVNHEGQSLKGTAFAGPPAPSTARESTVEHAAGASWSPPDSWTVRRKEDNVNKLAEVDDSGKPTTDEDKGPNYCIRVFRPDTSFATLALPLNTPAAEIVQILGRKNNVNDSLDNFQIILRKHDISRALKPSERPIAIQKNLLEQVGYKNSDDIENLGREDHSYLCRFNFLSAKMSGYSSLEKDPGFNRTSKFSNVDLSGRNLITIPIALYLRSSEIVFLNLSRNLSLDVPRDFIQGCTALREIRYTGNEAFSLPSSFSLASKLNVLDISNNRIDQLDHAELDKLENLGSFRLANNKLTSLPSYFANFKNLRSLNLSSNFLSEMPESLCEITTLADLDLSFNNITHLPNISKLENLERFWITNNGLTGDIEIDSDSMAHLREVDVRFNNLQSLQTLARLPDLVHLLAGHNSVSSFEGHFEKIRTLYLDHNPVTRFRFTQPIPSLTTLSLASAKLAQLPDDLPEKMPNVTKLLIEKNHFTSLGMQFGKLSKLEHLSLAKNALGTLPSEIGYLSELRFLDIRENNISHLPPEIWFCRKLETLNMSSNVLDSFPKVPTHIPATVESPNMSSSSLNPPGSPTVDEQDASGERRGSQSSRRHSNTGNNTGRQGSVASIYGSNPRKPSTLTRTPTESTLTSLSRKDSILLTRMNYTFVGTLRHLFLADNRLTDEVFDQLAVLQELRILNLSYNELYDVPPRTIRKWQYLSELYLSGNALTSLPAEDLEEVSALKILHINNNKFQVLPAELAKVSKLAVLDVASNSLKYNVNNWPYDWNWNWNPNLRYLNLSGNKRLEIKPASTGTTIKTATGLTDFSGFNALTRLRCLGLMDVTLMITLVPETTEGRRVRTSGSTVGSMQYGIADCLGRNENLSTMDIVTPRLETHEDETLFALFDGVPVASGGAKVVKYLQENFEHQLKDQLRRKASDEDACEPLRRTYLALNKDLAILSAQSYDARERRGTQLAHRQSVATQTLSHDDQNSGCVATALYLHGSDLFVSNVGDAQAVLIQSAGSYRFITENHDPASTSERERIREAGGYVSRQGKLNDVLNVSRAFGFTHLMPSVIAAPHTCKISLNESDEMILVATRELWDFLTPDFAVDIARSERDDLMRAAQKLRDIAIAFGSSGKITVMMIGVSDLRKRERARHRTHSMSMRPTDVPEEFASPKPRRREKTLDSRLARLDQEVEAPTGDVTLVFTDIKNSTFLWETYPIAMRSAIKMHNEVMRRQLRIIGGYEVKTEGDAFMVAFPTVTSAILWAFTIQSQLLEVPWPNEIVSSANGREINDADGNVLYRGLSVRMGVHWGQPVHEQDPITRRMDYFGPMVNRAARIEGCADGGEIAVSSDFIMEVQRLLETYIDESDNSNNVDEDDPSTENIRRELRSLSSHGFEVEDIGEKQLKGLENPEYVYLMWPHSLAGRRQMQKAKADADNKTQRSANHNISFDLDNLWDLWNVSLRLEMLCSSLEGVDSTLRAPETALLEKTRERGGEVTDRFLANFIEHQISRIETCVTSLALRNMLRPFREGMLEQACPMDDLFQFLQGELDDLRVLRESNELDMAPS